MKQKMNEVKVAQKYYVAIYFKNLETITLPQKGVILVSFSDSRITLKLASRLIKGLYQKEPLTKNRFVGPPNIYYMRVYDLLDSQKISFSPMFFLPFFDLSFLCKRENFLFKFLLF